MKTLQFPLVKINFFLIAGILVGFYTDLSIMLSATFLLLSVLILLFFYKLQKTIAFSITTFITSFFLGVVVQNLADVSNDTNHYSRLIKTGSRLQTVEVCVSEKLKTTNFANRYFAKVLAVDDSTSSGKILLNVYKASHAKNLTIGDVLQITTKLLPHRPPNNPNQFDYGKYLTRKSVLAQIYVEPSEILISTKKKKDIWFYADAFRNKIIENLRKHNFHERELQVVNALILGQQQELDQNVLQDYQLAGAVHVLSVSGLHVGIILLFLNFILAFLPKTKVYNILKFIIIILSLWAFAFVAGLSPSVVRSATMFSFLAAGQCLGRESNIFHTLIASLFFILLVEPSFIFDVGFQLSYMSLFFILWVQPMLQNLWIPKYKITKYFWDILTVSIAAQLGAFPLSIYYFHQFPGLFFFTNLVILPTLGAIMALGLVVMIMAYFGFVPEIPMMFLEKMIFYLNNIIAKIANVETFIIRDISLTQSMLWCLYLLLICIVFWFQKINFKRSLVVLTSIIFLQTVCVYNKIDVENKQSLLVFHSSKKSLVIARNGKEVAIYSNQKPIDIQKNKSLQYYLVSNFLIIKKQNPLSNLIYYNHQKILIVDSTFVASLPIKPDIVILRQSPKVNFDRFLQINQPKVIIADGSNYKSYLRLWSQTCVKQKILFHATAEKGFYEIR